VQKRKIQTDTKIFSRNSSSTFFKFSSSWLLEYGRYTNSLRIVLITQELTRNKLHIKNDLS